MQPAPSTLWYRAPAPPALPAPPAPIDVVEAEEEFEAGPPGDRVMGLAVDAPLLVMEHLAGSPDAQVAVLFSPDFGHCLFNCPLVYYAIATLDATQC